MHTPAALSSPIEEHVLSHVEKVIIVGFETCFLDTLECMIGTGCGGLAQTRIRTTANRVATE